MAWDRPWVSTHPPHSLFRLRPGAEGRKVTLWCSWGHGILVASSGTLEPDSPQGTLLSQMFPGYADIYFTGGKCEAYRGEVQVTDTVHMNSPAPMTLVLGYRSPSAPRNPEPGLADVSRTSGPILLYPLPSSVFQLIHSRKSLYSFQDLEDCPTLLIPKPRAAATSATPSPPAACAVGTRHSLLSP